MQVYLSTDGNLPNWDLIRAAFRSVANTAIFPAQDALGLDTDSRMNYPGKAEGNWTWRLREGELSNELAKRIHDMTLLYDRCNNPPAQFKKAVKKPPPY